MNPIRRVLFVDDEPQLLRGIELTFRRENFEVLTVSSASEALACVARTSVSVVVSDEDMPGQSGSALLRTLAERDADTVLVVLTGRPKLDAAVEVINSARVFRFLEKPCPPEILRRHLEDAFVEHERRRTDARLRGLLNEEAQRILRTSPESLKVPYAERLQTRLASCEFAELSAREIEVIERLVDGKRVRQLATELFISPHTVRNHLKNIFGKLNVHSQAELIEKCKA